MLNIFTLEQGRLVRITPEEIEARKPIWVDVIEPDDSERDWVTDRFGLSLPQPEHLRDIEASARFYEDNDELHLRSDFLLGKESESRSVIVAFVLANDMLFSVHDEDLPVFRLFRLRSHVQADRVANCHDVLIDLYGSDVEYSADALEAAYAELGATSEAVLNNTLSDKDAAAVLASIAHAEHVNGRIRRNLMDTRRAVSFLMRSKSLDAGQMEEARQIMQDIDSLDGHTAFQFDKINFLMNTTVGFININQNKIVRLFSVAAVVLLPPTLVASVYGMNFRHIPELEWVYGYGFALVLMVISVVLPLWVFRRKGWLK